MKELLNFLCLILVVSSVTQNDNERNAVSCILTGNSLEELADIKSSCRDIVIKDLTVPGGEILDLQQLSDGTTVTFMGNVTFEFYEWVGPLILVGGNNIKITGMSGHVIDGRGPLWWDGKGDGGNITKPKLFTAEKLYNSKIENIYIRNSPKHCFSILDSVNVSLTGITVNSKDGDTYGGKNTDAFDVGNSSYVSITNSTVFNQDDCLAVNSGYRIYFANNYCSGGHGISIGSIGFRENNVVEEVYIKNSTIADSDNGVRIKTKFNATGLVTGVTYEDIILENIHKFGITIRGDYSSKGGVPTGGVPITNLTLNNIKGTVLPEGTNVYVLVENASDWSWSNIDVTGGTKGRTCLGIPESGIGVFCS